MNFLIEKNTLKGNVNNEEVKVKNDNSDLMGLKIDCSF